MTPVANDEVVLLLLLLPAATPLRQDTAFHIGRGLKSLF